MLEVIEGSGLFDNVAGDGCFYSGEPVRPVTKFERRGIALGHGVWDLRFARIHDMPSHA